MTNPTSNTQSPISNPQSPIPNTQYPPHILHACTQLGWEIIGPPQIHPQGVVYFCRDQAGTVEPYTEKAILLECHRLARFVSAMLQAAGLPPKLAAPIAPTLSIKKEPPCCSG